jgi:PKD repeat protein
MAQAAGFASVVKSYEWTFGDGGAATTSSATIVHRYANATTYPVSVTESNANAQSATADGTLVLSACPTGTEQCRASLSTRSGVTFIQASGPIGSNASAELNLFSGSYRFNNCDSAISPAGSLTDSGFNGTVQLTFSYDTTNAVRIQRTCFASGVAFNDTSGARVHSGALPMCQTSGPIPPCVESIEVSSPKVTKVLLLPPGDPKFGS